jgi:hypothetical protein
MRPPFQFIGDPSADWFIFIGVSLVCLYWLRALRLAREGARLFLGNLAIACLVFIGCRAVLTGIGMQDKGAVLLPLFISIAVFSRRASVRRSRHIPASVRRAVIARDLKGEQYDSAKYHIDHVWAFARWGSHTKDNLRVIHKQKNLKKGAKRPKIWEMW